MTAGIALAGLLGPWAAAVEVAVVPATGALRGDLPTEVRVLAVDDEGRPWAGDLDVRASAGTWARLDDGAEPGVARFVASAPAEVEAVSVKVVLGADVREVELPVEPSPRSALSVRPIAHDADPARIRFAVAGDDLPDPRSLQVFTSEGRVVGIEREGGALIVDLLADDAGFARLVLVGVRDARAEGRPAFGVLRLIRRTEVPVESLPGTSVTLEVGGRRTTPVVVPPSGRAVVPVVHGPEDASGRIHLVDPYGNEATYPFPLPGQLVPRLVGAVSGPAYPGEAPPDVVLHGIRADGRPWNREAPACRSSSLGELPVVRIEAGTWRVRLPAVLPQDVWEVRLRCELGGEAVASMVVPLAESVPVGLDVKVWPEVLSTDLPVANLQVALLNVLGERVEARGSFDVSADLGRVEVDPRRGPALRAEYSAQAAVEVGEDRVRVAYRREPGEGAVDRLEVVGGPRRGERALVSVRLLDDQRRPLPGRALTLRAGGVEVVAVAGEDGWATLEVPAAGPLLPLVAVAGGVVHHDAVLVGAAYLAGPGRADLVAERVLRVDPGRVAEVELSVVPRLLRPGPRAEALVRAQLLDREGLLANAPMPTVSASEGALSLVGRADDGAWEWTFLPPPGYRARTVELVARSEALDVEERTSLTIRPPPVDRWLGVSAGIQTNFGRIVAPFAMAEAEWRIKLAAREDESRLGPSRFVGRLGLGWFGAQATTEAAPEIEGTVRMDLLPVTALLGLRQEYPSQAFWIGLGGVVAPFVGSASYGGVVVTRRAGILPPGVVGVVGYGVRVPGGEVALELKGTVLTSPGSDISFSGQVGGLAATLGYRVFYGRREAR